MRKIAALIFVVFLTVACVPSQSNFDQKAIEAAGDPIVHQLLKYKETYGAFPVTLDEARIRNAKTELGDFHYKRHGERSDQYFILSVGEHTKNGFTMFWNSGMKPPKWLIEE